MSITWHAVDLKTGRRGPQLATDRQGTMGRIIGEPTEVSGLGVLVWENGTAVPDWESATLPGRMMLVACDETDVPVWGGMILRRRATDSIWVNVDMATLEAYFDRRYVKDHTYADTAQGAIVSGILTGDVVPTGVGFTVDASSAMTRDRTYLDDEDKTALAVLQELMAVEDGPEFTVDLAWADEAHTVLSRIVRVRDRIGVASAAPLARFEYPGAVTGFEYVEDYSADNGANDVMAVSSGEGTARPESAHQVATDLIAGGWVTYERRISPSTSIINTSVLAAHARAELAATRGGLAQLTLEVALREGPLVGVDFHLGDDVRAVLTCPRFPQRTGPDGDAIPGYTKTVRCVGYEADYDAGRLKPQLWEP